MAERRSSRIHMQTPDQLMRKMEKYLLLETGKSCMIRDESVIGAIPWKMRALLRIVVRNGLKLQILRGDWQ